MNKNHNKKRIELHILFCICAALGWWGLLYPELAVTPDACRTVQEEGSAQEQEAAEWSFDSNLYTEVLGADRSRIRFRSRVLEEINAFLERRSEDVDE